MEYLYGKMEQNMKENLQIIKYLVQAKWNILMEEYMKESSLMVKCMERENLAYILMIYLIKWPDGRLYEGEY